MVKKEYLLPPILPAEVKGLQPVEFTPSPTPEKVLLACYQSVHLLKEGVSAEKDPVLPHTHLALLGQAEYLLEQAYLNSDPHRKAELAQIAPHWLVHVFDNLAINFMAPVTALAANPTLAQAMMRVYYRMENIVLTGTPLFDTAPFYLSQEELVSFGTASEVNANCESLLTHPNVIVYDDFSTFYSDLENLTTIPTEFYFLTKLCTLKEIDALAQVAVEIKNKYFSRDYRDLRVVAPFLIDGEVGGVAFLPFKERTPWGTRPSPVAKQDIYAALLKQGIPILECPAAYLIFLRQHLLSQSPQENVSATDFKSLLIQIEKIKKPQGEKHLAQRGLLHHHLHAPLERSNNPLTPEKYQKNVIYHYQRQFTSEHPDLGTPQVLLTRSGIAATEAVLKGIAKNHSASHPNNPLKIFKFGSYYENDKTAKDFFNISQVPEAADVFLFHPEPATPHRYKTDSYKDTSKDLLNRILYLARTQPFRTYYLVIDRTTDPFYEAFSTDTLIPPNLIVIKTQSLTKHVGHQNYFSGTIATWANDTLTQTIANEIPLVNGVTTPLSLAHFPLLVKETMTERRAHMASNSQLLTDTANDVLNRLPFAFRPMIETYPYYLFIYPDVRTMTLEIHRRFQQALQQKPDLALRLNQKYGLAMNDPFDLDSFVNAIYREYAKKIIVTTSSMIPQLLEEAFKQQIPLEEGDSFGLKKTRLNWGGTYNHKSPFSDANYAYEVLRICPGTDLTAQQAEQLGKLIGTVYLQQLADAPLVLGEIIKNL